MEKEIVKMQREMDYIPMRGRYCDIRMDLNCFDNESVYPIDTITIKINGNSAYALKWKKKFEKAQADYHVKLEDEERKEKSKKRKELIDKGIIKYVKNIGLVNTETGEVIKL